MTIFDMSNFKMSKSENNSLLHYMRLYRFIKYRQVLYEIVLSVCPSVSAITLERIVLRSPNLVYMTYGTIVRPSSKIRSLGQVLKGPAIRVHI
jgi:hypothetical protein